MSQVGHHLELLRLLAAVHGARAGWPRHTSSPARGRGAGSRRSRRGPSVPSCSTHARGHRPGRPRASRPRSRPRPSRRPGARGVDEARPCCRGRAGSSTSWCGPSGILSQGKTSLMHGSMRWSRTNWLAGDGLLQVREVRALDALLAHPDVAGVEGDVEAGGAGAEHDHAAALHHQASRPGRSTRPGARTRCRRRCPCR